MTEVAQTTSAAVGPASVPALEGSFHEDWQGAWWSQTTHAWFATSAADLPLPPPGLDYGDGDDSSYLNSGLQQYALDTSMYDSVSQYDRYAEQTHGQEFMQEWIHNNEQEHIARNGMPWAGVMSPYQLEQKVRKAQHPSLPMKKKVSDFLISEPVGLSSF